jgi:hypothetical protein
MCLKLDTNFRFLFKMYLLEKRYFRPLKYMAPNMEYKKKNIVHTSLNLEIHSIKCFLSSYLQSPYKSLSFSTLSFCYDSTACMHKIYFL